MYRGRLDGKLEGFTWIPHHLHPKNYNGMSKAFVERWMLSAPTEASVPLALLSLIVSPGSACNPSPTPYSLEETSGLAEAGM